MNNQLINDMVGDVRGWQGLSDLNNEKQKQAMLEVADLYRRVFSTADGKKILAILIHGTVMQPTVTPSSTQFEAGIREGRADIVRGILKQIELAQTGGQETLPPWQTLTPPQPEPVRKPRKQQAS